MGHPTPYSSSPFSSFGGDFLPRKVQQLHCTIRYRSSNLVDMLLWTRFEMQNRAAECIRVSSGNVMIHCQYPSEMSLFYQQTVTLKSNNICCNCVHKFPLHNPHVSHATKMLLQTKRSREKNKLLKEEVASHFTQRQCSHGFHSGLTGRC